MLSTSTYKSPFGEIGLLKEDENLLRVSFTDIAFKSLDAINNSYYLAKRCKNDWSFICLLYTSPSPRDVEESRMPGCG